MIFKFKILGMIMASIMLAVTLGACNSGPDTVRDGDLVIDKNEITEEAKFYPVEIDGVKMEVLAVKASDNTIRTAYNTCQVCFNSGRGYFIQQGDELVCQNCGNRFALDEIEVVRGGCNPVPITGGDKAESETTITISIDVLAEAKDLFAKWKR